MSRFHSQTPISDLRFIKDYLRRALSLINLLIQTQLVGFLNSFLEDYLVLAADNWFKRSIVRWLN